MTVIMGSLAKKEILYLSRIQRYQDALIYFLIGSGKKDVPESNEITP